MNTRCIQNYFGFHKKFSTTLWTFFPRATPMRVQNPGLNRQLKDVDNSFNEISQDPEGFGDLESDFMNVHKSHKQYEKEVKAHQERIKLAIVKNKYFKIKQPNFLTYAEKDQIKLLNSKDPNEWTAEKLSESFPADKETIIKILKANWIHTSEKRILKHDESVMKNWQMFKEGKFSEINIALRKHLEKFAERNFSDLKNMNIDWESKRPLLPKPKISEYSSIISSCKKYNEQKLIENEKHQSKNNVIVSNESPDINPDVEKNPGENETFLRGNIVNKKPMRFSELEKYYGIKPEQDYLLDNSITLSKDNNNKNELDIKKIDFNEISVSKADMKKYDLDPIKARIHIPKKLWKRGSTYKVQDCYYDYDGHFLYRVPGMTGNVHNEE